MLNLREKLISHATCFRWRGWFRFNVEVDNRPMQVSLNESDIDADSSQSDENSVRGESANHPRRLTTAGCKRVHKVERVCYSMVGESHCCEIIKSVRSIPQKR